MKLKHIIIIALLIFFSACKGFKNFDEESAFKFKINQPSQVAMGIENWDGPSDCAARAFLNQTNQGMLLTIFVKDDSVKTGDPQAHMNDGVELYFDFRPPRLRRRNFYETGVVQAIILPEPGKRQIAPITWFPQTYDSEIKSTDAYTELTDSGYLVQVNIPYFGIKRAHFWPRSRFFIDIAINDADTGQRESQIMWAGKSDNWQRPHNFEAVFFNYEERIREVKPNILLILTDQQTLRTVSAYGNKYLQTPNMDGLAAHGVRFTKSFCTSPISSPSRSSILTGRMPHETEVNYNGQTPNISIPNMGEIFQNAGYSTFWVGKWQLPEDYPHTTVREVRGFDLINFRPASKMSGIGEVTDTPLANSIIKYLKGRRREPFLLVASFTNPQDITSFPGNRYAYPHPVNLESAPPLPENFQIISDEPEFIRDIREYEGNEVNLTKNFSTEDWRSYLYHYYRLVEKVDKEIGSLISALEKEGLDENTLIIFTSDHGDGAASHKLVSNQNLYQESITVPFIFTWFGVTPAGFTDRNHLVSGIDVLPTMMDYAGIPIPPEIKGFSLKTIIEHPDSVLREYIVTQLASDPENPERLGRMITDGRYKYMLYSYGARNEQLFDLRTDPGETRNLAFNPEYSRVKNNLRSELMNWIDENRDYFRIQN